MVRPTAATAERINAMNEKTFPEIEQEVLTHEISDEAVEAGWHH
jgi:hypothetical protein